VAAGGFEAIIKIEVIEADYLNALYFR